MRISSKQSVLADPLKERLEQLESRAIDARNILKEIDEEKQLVSKLLELEMRRMGRTDKKRQRSISEIVDATLLKGSTNKEVLNRIALDEGHDAPARSIHAQLMSYFNNGYVVRTSDEGYGLTEKGKDALDKKTEGAQ